MAPALGQSTYAAYLGGGAEPIGALVMTAARAAGLSVNRGPRDAYPLPSPVSYDLMVSNPTGQTACFETATSGDRVTVRVSGVTAGNSSHSAATGKPRRPGAIAATGDILCDTRQTPGAKAPPARAATLAAVQVLREADLAMGNLEAPLTARETPTALKTKADLAEKREFIFGAAPAVAKPFIQSLGLDVALLANNHIIDQGAGGIDDTRKLLHKLGVASVGPAQTPGAAKTALAGVRGTPCRVIAFATGESMPPRAAEKIGAAWVLDTGPQALKASGRRLATLVSAARSRGELPIVSLHWGQENRYTPSAVQRELARVAAKAGAGLIVGHHPHVLQPVDVIDGCVVAYSMGNFVFAPVKPRHKVSAVLVAAVSDGRIVGAGVVPVSIARDGLPELVPDTDAPETSEVRCALGVVP